MHELGVTFYVIRDVKQVAQENNISKINSVTLEIVEVSGVVHELLIDCWDWAKKKEPVTQDAKLIINQIDAVTHCDACGKDYPTVAHGKICPHCGSEKTWLKVGQEFTIKEIEVFDD